MQIEAILEKFQIQYKPISGNTKYLICCPFHHDRNPSMTIRADDGLYGCFSCKAGGPNIQHFLKRLLGEEIDIREFVSERDEFNMKLNKIYRQSEHNILQYEELNHFHHIYKYHSQFFIDIYKNQEAIKYLKEQRNFTDQTIRKFKLQFCMADRYENRIIIPYYLNDKLIGFNSRLLGVNKEHGKELRYLYLLATKMFEGYLYNFENILNYNYCILVEGPFDLMWMVQNGYQNVISTLTTNISTSHLENICQFKKIIFCFDNDENNKGYEAVIKTSTRILNLFPEKEIYMVKLPEWKDPNETSNAELKRAFEDLKKIKIKC